MFDLEAIKDPTFLKKLKKKELEILADEIRSFLIENIFTPLLRQFKNTESEVIKQQLMEKIYNFKLYLPLNIQKDASLQKLFYKAELFLNRYK